MLDEYVARLESERQPESRDTMALNAAGPSGGFNHGIVTGSHRQHDRKERHPDDNSNHINHENSFELFNNDNSANIDAEVKSMGDPSPVSLTQ